MIEELFFTRLVLVSSLMRCVCMCCELIRWSSNNANGKLVSVLWEDMGKRDTIAPEEEDEEEEVRGYNHSLMT